MQIKLTCYKNVQSNIYLKLSKHTLPLMFLNTGILKLNTIFNLQLIMSMFELDIYMFYFAIIFKALLLKELCHASPRY